MFRGNFTVVQTPDGFIRGTFTGETPAGPFDVNLLAPMPFRMDGSVDGKKRSAIVKNVMSECLETAGYFPITGLVGKGPASYAKKLLKRLHSKDPIEKAKAWSDYKVLCAKAKAGQSRAMDICYTIARLKREVLDKRQYRVQGGPVLTRQLLEGFDYVEAVREVAEEARHNSNAKGGVQLYRALNKRGLKPKAQKAYARLQQMAEHNDDAEDIIQTVRTLSRSELERRRQLRQGLMGATLMGGFNFNKFMKSVGKVSGKLMKKLAPVAKRIPGYGAFVSPALKVVGEALSPSKKKRKRAKRKIKRVGRLARAGNRKASKAYAAMQDALKIRRVHSVAQGIRSGAIKKRRPPPRPAGRPMTAHERMRAEAAERRRKMTKQGPAVAKVLATDPKLVSAYYAGSYAGLRKSSKVFGKQPTQ